MKITTLFFFVLLTSFCYGQTKSIKNFTLLEESKTARYYKMAGGSYLDYYLPDKVIFNEKDYYVKIRKYSWGDDHTSYYREDDINYYHYDPKKNTESILLPKQITMGMKWLEADSSWSYEVIDIDKKLKTPLKDYNNLTVIECKQLTNRDKDKYKTYHMYYAEGFELIGSVNSGHLTSYLSHIKKDAKAGDKIGN
jgi:hypothetical protein